MSIGERIRNKRESLNISQTDLAMRVGISKQTLYKYENDIIENIPKSVIEKLSQQLECSPAFIMGWESNQMNSDLFPIISMLDASEKEELLIFSNNLINRRQVD
jgi:transcriptional regulator with XRE-family HTH domain